MNDPPVANDDSANTDEDTPVDIDVVGNDVDSDGVIDPTTGVVTYTPDTGYVGSDSFTYTVQDDDGAVSNEATVLITVDGMM